MPCLVVFNHVQDLNLQPAEVMSTMLKGEVHTKHSLRCDPEAS